VLPGLFYTELLQEHPLSSYDELAQLPQMWQRATSSPCEGRGTGVRSLGRRQHQAAVLGQGRKELQSVDGGKKEETEAGESGCADSLGDTQILEAATAAVSVVSPWSTGIIGVSCSRETWDTPWVRILRKPAVFILCALLPSV